MSVPGTVKALIWKGRLDVGTKLLDEITAAVATGSGPSAATIAAVDVLLGFDPSTTAIPKCVEWFFRTGTDDCKAVVQL